MMGGSVTLSSNPLSFQRTLGDEDINLIIESSVDLSTWVDATPLLVH